MSVASVAFVSGGRSPVAWLRTALAVCLLLTACGWVRVAHAQPQIPSTFFGTATVDGKTPPADTDIEAFVNGVNCTQPGQQTRFLVENGVGVYLVSVMHESQAPGCGKEGLSVSFTINGQPAGQTGTWKAGPQELDLNAGAGTPIPLPTATPGTPPPSGGTVSPAPAATPVPSASPSGTQSTPGGTTATSAVGASASATPGAQIGPASTAPAATDTGGSSAWPKVLLFGALVLAVAGVAANWWLRRRKR